MNWARRLVYDFHGLPYVLRLEVALELGLVEESDVDATESDRYVLWLKRARDRQLLDRFRALIDARMSEA
jgi:hypothetical protein